MRKSQYGKSELNLLVARENTRKKSMRMSLLKFKVEAQSVLTKLKITCRKNFNEKYKQKSYEIYCVSIVNAILENRLSKATCHFKESIIYNEPEELFISYSNRDMINLYEDLIDKSISNKFYPNYLRLSQRIQNILFTNISSKQNLIIKINDGKGDRKKFKNIFNFNENQEFNLDSDFYKLLEDEDEYEEDNNVTWHHHDKTENMKIHIQENSLGSIEILIEKLDNLINDVIKMPTQVINENSNKNEAKEIVCDTYVKLESVLFQTSSDIKSIKNYYADSINCKEKFNSVLSECQLDEKNDKDNIIKESLKRPIKFLSNNDFLKNIRRKEKENENRLKFVQIITERHKFNKIGRKLKESVTYNTQKKIQEVGLPKIQRKSNANSINLFGKVRNESKKLFNSAILKNKTNLNSDLNLLTSDFKFYTPVKQINIKEEKVNSVCNLIYSKTTKQFFLGASKIFSKNSNYK